MNFFHVLTLCPAAVTMEAPSIKVIVIIIVCISLILLPQSEACSASRNEPTITTFTTAQPNTECVSQREHREMRVRKKLFKTHFIK